MLFMVKPQKENNGVVRRKSSFTITPYLEKEAVTYL
jgi:hypothetical protein